MAEAGRLEVRWTAGTATASQCGRRGQLLPASASYHQEKLKARWSVFSKEAEKYGFLCGISSL